MHQLRLLDLWLIGVEYHHLITFEDWTKRKVLRPSSR